MKLTHIELHVPESERSAHWYSSYRGMVEVRRQGVKEKPVLWLAYPEQEDEFVMVLISYGQPLA